MKRRRLYRGLLALAVAAAAAAFFLPVSADGYGSCGQAAALPHLVLAASLLVVAACLTALLVQRARLP